MHKKQLKCAAGLTLTLGVCIALFHFGNPLLQKWLINDNVIGSKSLSTTSDSALPTHCIVTRIYQPQITYFPVLALGLYHNDLHNIRIYTINTDNRINIQQLKQTIKFINELVLRQDFVILLDLGEPPVENDYGYAMTDRALAYLYKQYMNSSSICQYVTFTNGDNFYSRNFAKKILPHMKSGKDIISWNFVSHHYVPVRKESIDGTVSEIVDNGMERCIAVKLKTNYVDLGAVAYRLSFLQKYNLYFQRPDGVYTSGSDGYFVEQAVKRTNASVILRQTIFMHQ